MFYRERGALPYDPFAYGIAIAIVEVPYLILQVRTLSAAVMLQCVSAPTLTPTATLALTRLSPMVGSCCQQLTGLACQGQAVTDATCWLLHGTRLSHHNACWSCLLLQVLLFVPVIYTMVGFSMVAEKFFLYAFMFLASISFYTIFGQFMVYVTPSQQTAQVSTDQSWQHATASHSPRTC